MVKMKKMTMDGNEAAAYASYAFTEIASIYPITPSSPMAEHIDRWSANGRKNIFGQEVKLVEMQSEAGAVAAMHGAMEAGVLASSYTSSQGLLLMIPTMYRISGHLKCGVIHVASRAVATHGYSIFAEHSDVMACRQTGFALLASSNVQECMDFGAIAHLASIKGSVPFLHFFDGFRTSHEIQKIDVLDYDQLAELVDKEALEKYRNRALHPEHPVQRTVGQPPEIYFQNKEAVNEYYIRLPEIVEYYMQKINDLTGRKYGLFNYYGDENAESVIVAMGSVGGTIRETVEYLNSIGKKVGFVQINLYRPFSKRHFMEVLPKSVRKITVLDRTKEPGAVGEPLYEDVCSAINEGGISPLVLGGRYGLGGKDTNPSHIAAVFENAERKNPMNHFTVGIEDDVTHISLEVETDIDTTPEGTVNAKFWGLGSDGTVSANQNTIKIIGNNTDMFVQAYFEYDGKKSGGVTKSHLRFGNKPIHSSYYVKKADFVACHNQSYIGKYDMISELKKGGAFLLNCSWGPEELEEKLPAQIKKYIAQNQVQFYTIDATKIAKDLGLGNRINTILQAAFFKITQIIPIDEAARYMKELIRESYGIKGEKTVILNQKAVDRGISDLRKIDIPAGWANLPENNDNTPEQQGDDFIHKLFIPIEKQMGDSIKVSAFKNAPDGSVPLGTSKYGKRGIAGEVPSWNPQNCIQCNLCSYVCPHSAIRPFLLDGKESDASPAAFKKCAAKGKGLEGYMYTMQVSPLDCMGCGSCVHVCPSKNKALTMKPAQSQTDEINNWEYALKITQKDVKAENITVKNSQFRQPLLEFPGACPGCGETPYAKLVTQLFGDRMYIATATGCPLVWSTDYPSFPYTTNSKGHGPSQSNSLFENNAEFGLGIALGVKQLRERLRLYVKDLAGLVEDTELKRLAADWVQNYMDADLSRQIGLALVEKLKSIELSNEAKRLADYIKNNAKHLTKKSIWLFGGDGWAYDIGYGGLDHVLASGEDVNILVMDTEVYSNTGGQASKATPKGAVAKFAASGMKRQKKDLGRIAMCYDNVYVAQVAMGANPAQTLKAILEAEAHPGPSLVIAYAPCISHGLKCGIDEVQSEMKRAVDAGYWHLYRYNPAASREGKNGFILDSKEPTGSLRDFIMGEVRFASLFSTFPDIAERLVAEAEMDAKRKYELYSRLAREGEV